EVARRRPILLPPGDPTRSDQGPGPRRRSAGPRGHGQDLHEPPPPLGEVTPLLPEAPQRGSGVLGPLGLIVRDRPPKGGPDVGVLSLAPVEPFVLVRAREVGFGFHRKVEEVPGVTP